LAALSFLDREHSLADLGYSRWLVPPAAWAVNLSIGQVYAFSVFKIPLTRQLGITHSAAGDWSQPSVAWIFSFAIAVLGLSAALFGRWIEREGPRKAMFAAALCFGLGFFIAAAGVRTHQLWLIYLGYGGIGGIGLGLGYITPVATLLKWFPDRPGLATGLAMVGFGGGAMVGSPLALLLMGHFHSPTDTGVSRTFLVLGIVYLLAMASGALLIRIPREGWQPEGATATATSRGLVSDKSVSVTQAVRTRQFWLLWLVICLNSIAGFGILEQASPMIQDLFGIGAVAAGGFVGVLSLFNMAGRFFWSSVSDYLGRKTTFVLFFAFGILLYWFLPYSAGNHINSIALFVLVSGVLISIYGGGFSTIPAYVKDMFGTSHVGAIYGRVQTATSTAGILGPILVNYSRQHQLALGVSRAGAYQHVLHLVTGLLVLGLLANLLVSPVASKFWIAKDSAAPKIQTVSGLAVK
jgi:MFS family permease